MLRLLIVFPLLLLLVACASQPAVMRFHQPAEAKVFPPPPVTARYVYGGALTGEDNFSRPQSEGFSWRKLGRWLVGLLGIGEEERKLQRPQAGVVGGDGRIYVTDVGRRAVFVFDERRGRLDIWEDATATGGFVAPLGIALDGARVFVADGDLGVVIVLDGDGDPLAVWGRGQLQRPVGLAYLAARQELWVSDAAAHQIVVFDREGRLLRRLGNKGDLPLQFNAPTYLAAGEGKVFVSDTLNARVQVLDHDGAHLKSIGRRGTALGDTPRPKGVASDGGGRLYIVESYYDYLLVYDADGRFLLPIGGTGRSPGRFQLPAGVWTDAQERVYVADMMNGRVVRFDYLHRAGTSEAAQNKQ